MGWLIALGIVTALALLPLGVSVKYDSGGALVRLFVGPIQISLFPRPQKGKKASGKNASKKSEQKNSEEATLPQPPQPPKQEKKEKGGSFLDFIPLVKVLLRFLGDLRRKLRVRYLQLKLILAGEDPCDLAVNYGRAWAAVGNLMPQLERLFVIKQRDVEVECDFTATETKVIARLDLTIPLGRLLSLAVVYGIRALKEYLNLKNKRKGGATHEPDSQHA